MHVRSYFSALHILCAVLSSLIAAPRSSWSDRSRVRCGCPIVVRSRAPIRDALQYAQYRQRGAATRTDGM
jgi:hypothetical protein